MIRPMLRGLAPCLALLIAAPVPAADKGGELPGSGKTVVLVSGDEEYRSEEALPQLARILTKHHGFACTVLYAVGDDGTINPNKRDNIPGLDALRKADLMIIATRFRDLPDDQMKEIVDYVDSGRPVIGLRTATHAFNIAGQRKYSRYSFNSKEWDGGFGRQVLGETWINHHGHHGHESTRGIVAPGAESHPILRGIKDGDIWGPTDVYAVRLPLPGDSKPLVLGQVVEDMKVDGKPVSGPKNDPMMPIAWVKTFTGESGKPARVFTTTMGGGHRPRRLGHSADARQRHLLGVRLGGQDPGRERRHPRRRVRPRTPSATTNSPRASSPKACTSPDRADRIRRRGGARPPFPRRRFALGDLRAMDQRYRRQDESPDALFYRSPRFVTHIDDRAIAAVTQVYREFLPPGGAILDLMSSWVSHLPAEVAFGRVVGLGMNEAELARNPRLTSRVVHDLNLDPTLPFPDAEFDAATLCVSVDYLTRPGEVLADVARVVRAGGPLVITFSDRCFPTKAVREWLEADDRGRKRLVVGWLEESGRWDRVETLDRGRRRPTGDPLYAVVARSRGVAPGP